MKKAIVIVLVSLISFSSIAQSGNSQANSKKKWSLIWKEEFNYEGLPDASKWNYEVGHIRNNEQQYYTEARRENIWVSKGVLTITGRKENYVNKNYKPGSNSWQQKDSLANYTSASINTLGKVSWKYGKIEVSAKLPRGAGIWPAIWMMGTNTRQVGWPFGGEIDVMEFVGNHPNEIHGTIHFIDTIKRKHASSASIMTPAPTDEKFHVYAIEWNEEKIDILYDGRKYHSFANDLAGKGDSSAFRKPFYLLINLAMGAEWPGPIDESVLPQQFQIDYVRVYK